MDAKPARASARQGPNVRVVTETPCAPEPDDKDWTWVLERPCPDCGFDPGTTSGRDVARIVLASIPRWRAVLHRPDATVRPSARAWSPAEYACHVRDVFALFDLRARQMLTEDDPVFANWDQDATARSQRYWAQSPTVVATELSTSGAIVAATFDHVADEQWQRPGRRSNGSVFTVDTLGRYFAHDVVHHLHDVGG